MHAILITFTSQAAPEELHQGLSEYADALSCVPGFISKAWLHNETTLGGFYLFATREAANGYLSGELVTGLQQPPLFSDFSVWRYDILTDLSARTGVTESVAEAPTQ
jgi:Putative mono-oxygenase ydhR